MLTKPLLTNSVGADTRFASVSRSVSRFLALGLLAILLSGCESVVLNPSGDMALQQSRLLVISTMLMLLIIVPVIALTCLFAWRYRSSNTEAEYDPEWDHSTSLEFIIWGAPLMIIIILGLLTWIGTHTLDPYRKLDRIDENKAVAPGTKPLRVEVVALDWKWLFIYPDLNVATVNELAAPVNTPIEFKITASSVMNSFFVPALVGQIYAMPGMQTSLNAVINQPGDYQGFSANYSGAGFSDMKFTFRGMSKADFDQWVQSAKADKALDLAGYRELAKPSERVPVMRFSTVDADLYHKVLNRCVDENSVCMDQMMMTAEQGDQRYLSSQPKSSIRLADNDKQICTTNASTNLATKVNKNARTN